MFEDQTAKQPAPPENLPTEPADMFAEVDKGTAPVLPNALEAGLLNKKAEVAAGASAAGSVPPVYTMKEPILGKILLFIILAAILGGLGYGGYWIYTNYLQKANPPAAETKTPVAEVKTPAVEKPITVENETKPVTVPTSTDIPAKMNNDKILFGEPVDSDKDKLDDVREAEIGTDPEKADTDNDGLSDYEEVVNWKTDPLNKDTDGDSYLDGEEVFHGYNPLGPGKITAYPAGVTPPTTTVANK